MSTVKGEYVVQVREQGALILEHRFHNLITDLALTHESGNPFDSGFLCIGTGSTAPDFTDTALESEIDYAAGTFESYGEIVAIGSSRYARRSVTASFSGNNADITEVGFKLSEDGELVSRSLIRDGLGQVTKIPAKAVQTITISYFVYFLIPESYATGVFKTPYGSYPFSIEPPGQLSNPTGVIAGRFAAPYLGRAIRAELTDGSYVDSDAITWEYNAQSQIVSGLVYFAADSNNRTVEGFKASGNSNSLPVIVLETPFTIPADSDMSFTLAFNWERA